MTFVRIIGGRTGAELRIDFAKDEDKKSVIIRSILATRSILVSVSGSRRITSSKLNCAKYSVLYVIFLLGRLNLDSMSSSRTSCVADAFLILS